VTRGEQKKTEDAIAFNVALIVLKQCKDAIRPRPMPTDQQTLPASDGPVRVTTGPVPADPVPALNESSTTGG
jgi:hypothetical protein